MTSCVRISLVAFLPLLVALPTQAQLELKGEVRNTLWTDSIPVGGAGSVTAPQFAGRGAEAASSGPVHPAAVAAAPVYDQYPSAKKVQGVTVTSAVVLRRSTFGGAFASGVPRYSLGDVIVQPETIFGSSNLAPEGYWRPSPVVFGEQFTNPGSPALVDPDPLPPETPAYYYSPHAGKVFAHQAGRVRVVWVTQQPVYDNGTLDVVDGDLEFRFVEEIFSVSTGSSLPVRRIYWTERGFNGPKVTVPTGRIVAVNPAYSTAFPGAVAEEYEGVGVVEGDPGVTPPPELRTLWFENTAGLGQLRAYNQQGRILVEYLGELLSEGQHEFLGADIVEVTQVAQSTKVDVNLGEQIQAHNGSGQIAAEADELLPSAVQNLTPDSVTYYGTSARPDSRLVYHAEWENLDPTRVSFYWLEETLASIHFLGAGETPDFSIAWPKYLNQYRQLWPQPLDDYVGVTVTDDGSDAMTSVSFAGGPLPTLVHQDDGSQTEASVDVGTQRFLVDFTASTDKTNRSLLKFNAGDEIWYVRLFTQSESVLGSPEVPEVPDPDGSGPLQGTPLIPAVHTLADRNADGVRDLSVAGGGSTFNISVGDRIERPSSDYELGGYISHGTGYLPDAYQDPFVAGVDAAATGAIIPVNAMPANDSLTIWWFTKIQNANPDFPSFFVPSVSAVYQVSYPIDAETLVLASNDGSGDLSPARAAGTLYFQNDSTLPGYNPNEEHALMLAGRVYALRDDLNVTAGPAYTSEPFVLLSYIDPSDSRPAVEVYEVVREDAGNGVLFDYPVTAGSQIPAPMPLPLLPLPVDGNGNVRNVEVPGIVDLAPDRSAPVALYDRFTFEDRKGFIWVYRGPHNGGAPTLGMQFYYRMQESFFVPGETSQPAVGTALPYLRPLSAGVPQGHAVTGTPLTITYRPVWPDTVPELRVAETLTLPKFGLPQVRGQTSVEVLYQQSIAVDGAAATSVTLHDPTRAKKVKLSEEFDPTNPTATASREALLDTIATTVFNGRTYFQRLPPHLQQRFYLTPILGGDLELALEGEFVDEIAGDDYLNLNVLSTADIDALKGLADPAVTDKSKWDALIDGLATAVETFIEDPNKKGTYMVDSTAMVGEDELATISDSDTAVDSYALTATGQGTGYVSVLFADGEAFTPTGDPVSIAVIKVAQQLYVGDMKVQFSSNPLDEQVTLRHSGDFAAKPEDYEFEWRYAPLADGLPPATYAYNAPAAVLDNATQWQQVQNPAGVLPNGSEYATASPVGVPRTVTIHDGSYAGTGAPGVVLMNETDTDFTAGIPAQVIFSADLSNDLDGLVLYVNGSEVLAFRAPSPFDNANATTGLSGSALTQQFNLSPQFFTAGVNRIEVALYSDADPLVSSQVNFRLETVSRNDRVDPAVYAASPWQQPTGTLQNIITLGGSPTAPLGNPILLLQDNAFTVRYRPKLASGNILAQGAATQNDVPWSDWMDAKVIPGWVKRVLDAINPYNQRVTDLFNSAVNTDVSVLTQAGTRWEGDIALTLDNVDDAGLIEIYETVLNRAKNFSIDNGYDVPGVNDALLLAAGYLNDLYIILGNEAYADAANPTISLDDQDTITEVNTSRFSFEGQVASSLEEELALLRGRDDFLATSVATAPAYNRLYWNYTNGIDSGEVLYAVNYNIKEKVGSATQDGIIDAADAQRMFPQAHGDAYGHYLTALKGYYRLLTNGNFTWTPRSEVVLVLGQNVSVDYFDERKFAGAAANVARTAEQTLALTWRQAYKDDEAEGWEHFRDNKPNSRTNERRQWGVDEWASRAGGGAYINWVVGNAMLPEEDTNPNHNGIQIIDRQTVPELLELATAAASVQSTMDKANAHLNPLGLSSDAVAFDISPAELKAGNSHFEQVYQRALTAVLNAKGSFDQAGRMTRLLRNQDNQIDDYNTTIEDQERAFKYKLIDLFGTPYTADVGPGKTYAQGYDGPDLIDWFLIDEATEGGTVDLHETITTDVLKPFQVEWDAGSASVSEVFNSIEDSTEIFTVTVEPNRLAQVADVYFGASAGERTVTGELQTAILKAREKQVELLSALDQADDLLSKFSASKLLYDEMVANHLAQLEERRLTAKEIFAKTRLQKGLEGTYIATEAIATGVNELSMAVAELFPKILGLSNDATSGGRGAVLLAANVAGQIVRAGGVVAAASAGQIEAGIVRTSLEQDQVLEELKFNFTQRQFAYEFSLLYEDVIDQSFVVAARAEQYQRATEEVRNVLARGDRLLAEREIFRLRAAAIIQGYRTRDVAFRAFRNEALEQYRTLFDLGARYTYLAAKSYDYETGLLGTTEGQAVINRIVASRALGDLTNGVPQATTSTLGDAGLAGTMAQLVADFAVAEGRLGINNPDQNGTLFSMRHELFRLGNDPAITADDDAWQQTLEQHIVSDVRSDADVMRLCHNIVNPDGSRTPAIVIPFSTTILHGMNWFGLPYAGGDHNFSPSNFATKVYSVGAVFPGYVGMDPYAFGTPSAGGPATNHPDVLGATPYVYLIPVGEDSMRAPPLGDTNTIRSWNVQDQALPLPYNLGASDFNGTQFFQTNGTLTEQPWIGRKHQAFRAVDDPAFFYSLVPQEFTSRRLIGRSVWNSQWKLVIPAYALLNDEEEGLERFVRSVRDIQLFLRTYSHSGN